MKDHDYIFVVFLVVNGLPHFIVNLLMAVSSFMAFLSAARFASMAILF